MKKIFLLAIIVLISANLFAQESKSKDDDTLKIKWKNSRIWIFDAETKKDTIKKEKKKKQDFTHWGGFDFGVCMLSTAKNQFNIPEENDTTKMNYFLNLNYSKSFFFSLNLLEKNIRLYKNYVNVVTGLGFEWNSYNFKNKITLPPNASYISASNVTIAPDSITFKKNKLKVAYLKAPLLLEFNTNTNHAEKSFHIAGGVELAYKIGSRTKQVYEMHDNEYKIKRKEDFNLAPLKYSAVVRAGYGNYFTLFVNYSISQLFEKEKGPEVFPITAGISFTL
ncbi:MAG: outer membrane beta-barrel protein [Bacteroidetes bacterium]|nr:outer membrane beta-barrel protein [Bacteroidota bacterium]